MLGNVSQIGPTALTSFFLITALSDKLFLFDSLKFTILKKVQIQ